MPRVSSLSAGALPCHVTPKRRPVDASKKEVVFEEEEEEEEDTTEDSFSEKELLGQEEGEAEEGFLKAKNSSDAYFLAHGKSNPTSKNLLSERKTCKLPLPVADYLESFDPKPLPSAQTKWKQWTAELVEGYSLLFHGLGSKRVTLNEFVEHHLVGVLGWEGLVVNGFQTGADLSNILGELEDMVLNAGIEEDEDKEEEMRRAHVQRKASSLEMMESRARQLCTSLSSKNFPRCVLLVHNLDGVGLRNSSVQTILSLLAAQPSIHLVASIDHIYAPILLPSHIASASPYVKDSSCTLPSNYNFLYHHLPTQTPYTLESLLSGTVSTLFPSSIFPTTMVGSQSIKADITQSGATTSKATLQVLSSLTEKAKSLFRILAEHQLSQQQQQEEGSWINQEVQGQGVINKAPGMAISATKLFELARSQFVASFPTQMHAMLVEFRDHNIILAAPSSNPNLDDDDEWLWIALSHKDLQFVLSKLDNL